MKMMVTMALALAMAIPATAQGNPAPGGMEIPQWERQEIEREIRLTLDFRKDFQDQICIGPGIYRVEIINSFPNPAYREQEEIIRTYLADYVTDLRRDYSIIRGRKTAKSAAPEYLVDMSKHAPLEAVMPLADRKIIRILQVQEKDYKYVIERKIEFVYDFVPHVPGLALKSGLKGSIVYGANSQEQILGIETVSFEDQGVLEFKKNQ